MQTSICGRRPIAKSYVDYIRNAKTLIAKNLSIGLGDMRWIRKG